MSAAAWPGSRPHRRAEPSSLLVMMLRPSALKPRYVTKSLWPLRTAVVRRAVTSHRRAVWSTGAEVPRLAGAEAAAAMTGFHPLWRTVPGPEMTWIDRSCAHGTFRTWAVLTAGDPGARTRAGVASLISRNSVCRRSSEAVGDPEAPKCRAEMTAVRWWGLRNIHVRGACPGRTPAVTPFDAVACRGRQGGVARAGAGVCRPSAGRTGGSRRAGGGMRPWRPPGTHARRRCWPGAGG